MSPPLFSRSSRRACPMHAEPQRVWITPAEEPEMAVCDTCGNDYDKAFEVKMKGKTHTFDSFECAIQKLAPVCAHCACRVNGHGVEARGTVYCCAHCAGEEGVQRLQDRV